MKKVMQTAAYALVFFVCLLSAGRSSQAGIEWTERKQLKLDVSPIDLVSSPDGKWVIVLSPGEVLVYSIPEDKVISRMSIDKTFDKLVYSAADETIILSNSTEKTIKFISLDTVHAFSFAGLPFKGPENAPVAIVVFNDYQWPYCARLEPFLQQLLVKYPKEVKLVLKNFPLPMHPFARNAAIAALAANNQGKYWEFSRKLFENSASLGDAKIQDIAKQLGLDMAKFNRDLTDASIQRLLANDMNDVEKASVQGTPSVFINGKAVKNLGANEIQVMIERELRKKK